MLQAKSKEVRIKNVSAPGRSNSSCTQIGKNLELNGLIRRKTSSFDEDILNIGTPPDSGLPPLKPSDNKTGRNDAMRIQTSA